jgi:hypothetical protein
LTPVETDNSSTGSTSPDYTIIPLPENESNFSNSSSSASVSNANLNPSLLAEKKNS